MPRLRKITNASNLISTYDILLKVPHEENSNAILEIGCGKGQWLTQNAIKFPHNQYFGIECDATIILKLLRKLHRQSFIPNNLHIIHDDARNLLN